MQTNLFDLGLRYGLYPPSRITHRRHRYLYDLLIEVHLIGPYQTITLLRHRQILLVVVGLCFVPSSLALVVSDSSVGKLTVTCLQPVSLH